MTSLLTTGQPLADTNKANLPRFAQVTLHWALLNLRSFAVGMRIDQWIADEYPMLRDSQAAGVDALQQENLRVMSQRVGNLSVPVPLLAPVAAYAKFADRLLGTAIYSIPYRAAGVLESGVELLRISDSLESELALDCALVDAWAASIGMTGWFAWKPYRA